MATNQVINGKNRLVEHPNRYKLNAVSGAANTYDLEKQPGEITDNGTPYSKLILDKIDNVLSYLTPSVEKVEQITPIPFTKSTLVAQSVDTTLAQNGEYEEIISTCENIDGKFSPMLKIHNQTGKIKLTANGSTSVLNSMSFYRYSTYYYTSTALLSLLMLSSQVSNNHIYMLINVANPLYFDYDFFGETSGTINLYFHTFTRTSGKILGSNDGTTWTQIGTLARYQNAITFSNYRYIRVELKGVNSESDTYMDYIYFSNLSGTASITSYQNQFTLDNNGTTFTNNQRVFLETPKLKIENTPLGTSWNLSSDHLKITNSNGVEIIANGLGAPASTSYLTNILDGNTSTDWCLCSDVLTSNELTIDLKDIYEINTFKTYIPISLTPYIYFSLDVKYSEDGTTWTNWFSYDTTETALTQHETNNLHARYIKFIANQLRSGSSLFIKEIEMTYSEINGGGMSLDGVTSNTINNVLCDTLLQPSTKYELIYKESDNKFVFGNLTEKQPLFDITLTEAVNQIDLTGLIGKLEVGKKYVLYIDKLRATSSDSTLYFLGAIMTNSIGSVYNCLYVEFYVYDNGPNKCIVGNGLSTSSSSELPTIFKNITSSTAETLRCSSSFKENMRVIIKEVA